MLPNPSGLRTIWVPKRGKRKVELVLSKHAEERMQQRGMRPSDIQLICEFGTETRDGYFLRSRDKARAISDLKNLIGRLEHLDSRYVVVDGNHVLTAYKASTRKQKKILNCR